MGFVKLSLLDVEMDQLRLFCEQEESMNIWARVASGEPRFYERVNFLPKKITAVKDLPRSGPENSEDIHVLGELSLNGDSLNHTCKGPYNEAERKLQLLISPEIWEEFLISKYGSVNGEQIGSSEIIIV